MCRKSVWLTCLILCGLSVQDAAAQRWRYRYGPPGYGPAGRAYGSYRPYPDRPTQAYGPIYADSNCSCQEIQASGVIEPQPVRPTAPYIEPPIAARGDASAGSPSRPALKPIPMPEVTTGPTPQPPRPRLDIKATLEAQGQFSDLLKSAKVAGVYDLLDNPGPFTIFAPTDQAFRALDPGVLARLTAAPDRLKEVMLYHALAEKLPAADAQKQGRAKTVLGPDVRFRGEGGRVFVNDAPIIRSDVQCTNGVLHTIDRVLFPPGFKFPDAASPTKAGPPPVPAAKKEAEKPGQKGP
jgi:uncharacterized surface protein with fasciclin (FAS1) repeats